MAFLDHLHAAVAGRALAAEEAEDAMRSILTGTASVPQIAAFLVALRMKGETGGEILGLARAMRAHSLAVDLAGVKEPVVDTCGTGGDASGSFNISTVTALVVAGAGVSVAKHGNRSLASHCGSADLFEALGVKIALAPAQMSECLRRAGIAFLFAPALHPAMKHAQPARAEIKLRTALNLLGPLTNPAGAPYQLIGAPSETAARLMASALAQLGTRRAFVVHGSDGLDEIATTGPTLVLEATATGTVIQHTWHPEDFGVPRAAPASFAAASKEDNIRIAREVLAGQPGPCRDIVLVNAAAALYVCGAVPALREGVTTAAASIDTGAASETLRLLIDASHTC